MPTPNDQNVPPAHARELLPTRQSLIERLGTLDDPSWREFFQIYWQFIYGTARGEGLNDSEAQEVVQETIIYMSRKMPGFKYDRARGSFKGWLSKLIHWRIVDQKRKRDGHRELFVPPDREGPDPFLDIPDPALNHPGTLDEEWERNLFEAALQRVKERIKAKQFQIFDLYVMKQWPIKKITATLGVNFAQVYLAKHRVTGLIRDELKKLRDQY